MPRLDGYTETRRLNMYDAIGITTEIDRRALNATGGIRLFGPVNIGTPGLTDMQIPHQAACDQTTYVQNVYARTNINTDLRAFREWAETAIATLVIGARPQLVAPIGDLVRIGPGEVIPTGFAKRADHVLAQAREMALQLYAADVAFVRRQAGMECAFDDLDASSRERWLALGHAALRALKAPPVYIIGVRQSFSVEVQCDPAAYGALCRALEAQNILPAPYVWVHLEGFSRRDVA